MEGVELVFNEAKQLEKVIISGKVWNQRREELVDLLMADPADDEDIQLNEFLSDEDIEKLQAQMQAYDQGEGSFKPAREVIAEMRTRIANAR